MWDVCYDFIVKFFYGWVFCVFVFVEIYGIVNLVSKGNFDLKLEIIDIIEVVFFWLICNDI